jgi:dienelactone hydrolase
MASHPPAQCCTIGVKHEGEASGEITKLGSSKHPISRLLHASKYLRNVTTVEVYIAHPPEKSDRAVIILPDVIGHKFINAQLIADQYAANGYLTVMPDIFQGDPIPLNRPADFDFNTWRQGHGVDKVDPIIEEVIKELKGKYGAKKIGGVGYCFGAKGVVRFLKAGKFDAGYVAHPSFVDAEEIKAIEKPLSIVAASKFPPSGSYARTIVHMANIK